MSVQAIIKSRRTVYQFLENSVSEDIILKCLESAIWAPNHKMRQPWFFWTLGEKSKQNFAVVYADNRAKKKSQSPEDYQQIYQKAFDKFIAIPEVVLVGQKLVTNLVDQKEDYAACACAIQNFQLAAHEQGLGVQWSTGPIINDERSYQILDIRPEDMSIIGALYLGYPACESQSCRKPLSAHFKALN